MNVFSHSRLSCFEQCPYKFKVKYIDNIEPDYKDGVEAFLGKRVHETLEKLYNDLKFKKKNSLQELLVYYLELWNKKWHKGVKIVREQYDEDHYKSAGIAFISQYYETYAPFEEDVLSVEEHVKINVGEGYFIQGYIDRLDQTPTGYEVHDYKTSNSLPSQNNLDQDRQLALYALAVKEKFGDGKDVELVWHYVAHNKEMRSKRTDEELATLKEETLALIKKVKAATSFPTKKSTLCGWCEYRSKCPEFKHLYELEQKTSTDFEKDDGTLLVNEFTSVYEEKKDAERRLEELKKQIIAFAKQYDVTTVFGTVTKARVSEGRAIKFPSKGKEERELIKKLLEDWNKYDEFSDLDTTKLAKNMESLPEALQDALGSYLDIVESTRVTLSEKE